MPSLPPDDEGTWRRISVIEFRSRFIDNPDPNKLNEFKKDTHLTQKLNDWKEAFMYILLEEYKDYKKTGLVEPKMVRDATNEYHSSIDSVGTFCKEYIKKSSVSNSYIKLSEIQEQFKFSDFYDSSIKPKDFKKLVIKSLNIEWYKQKVINKERILSVFLGVEWIESKEETKIDPSLESDE